MSLRPKALFGTSIAFPLPVIPLAARPSSWTRTRRLALALLTGGCLLTGPAGGGTAQAGTPHKVEAAAKPDLQRRTVEAGRGDTLLELLVQAGAGRDDADSALEALSEVYDPHRIRVGQEVTVLIQRESGGNRLVGLELDPTPDRSVSVSRVGTGEFAARSVEKPLDRHTVALAGEIRSSLFEAGTTAGVPVPVMTAIIKAFSYDVDFQRDIQPGDRFRVVFERWTTRDGETAREGEVVHAALVLSGEEKAIFRYKTPDGGTDWFTRGGESIRKALLRTPVDGARLTSGFGMRHHPLLGYTKMHKGVDFGASTGTPVFAAGTGTVAEAGRKGAYGNYVRIRHNQDIATAYAHLSRFRPTLRPGARVEQGEVIGYVGATGRATGPHLHYEVLRDNHQVNPMSVDLPTGTVLRGRELVAFHHAVEQIENQFHTGRGGAAVAHAAGRKPVQEACNSKAQTC